MDAKVWCFLLLMRSTFYSAVIVGKMFCEAKHLDIFMPGILVLQSLECTSLNEDQADVAVRNEGRLHSCKPLSSWYPRARRHVPFFLLLFTQEWTRLCIMSVSEAQSLQRPALLRRCDLNLASKPKLAFVTVGDKMPAGTGSKQHDFLGVFKSLI